MERNDGMQSTGVDWCAVGGGYPRPEEMTDMVAGKSKGGGKKGERCQNFSMLSVKRVSGGIGGTEGDPEQR